MKPDTEDRASLEELSRRQILAAVAIAAGAIAMGGGLPLTGPAMRPAKADAEAAILALLRDREGASQIGGAVLAANSELGHRERLLSDLTGEIGLDGKTLLELDAGVIAERLAQRIRDDFASRRTVKIDGWIVSMTECRICALAALAGTG